MTGKEAEKVILAVNAGSSSVKISVYSAAFQSTPSQLAEASITGLTSLPASLDYTRGETSVFKDKEIELKPETTTSATDNSSSAKKADDRQEPESIQTAAFRHILTVLTSDHDLPQVSSKDDISLVAHRIVHGGDYKASQVITKDTYHHLEALNDLAPLHNAKGLEIVASCMHDLLPRATNLACFDSQFHTTIPPHVAAYPINQDIAKTNGLRKYGFHGLSYAFVTRSAAEFLGKAVEETSIIALHLGSGASACAIGNGKSLDTSMGLTPLAGLPGATRSGSIDPSLVFHYASDVGKLSPSSTKELHISRAEEILNQEAGWKAMTGTTNFGTIAAAAANSTEKEDQDEDKDKDNAKMRLAFDLFVDRISAFIGSYYVSLRGDVDALVFAGGIGEKSDTLRAAVVKQIGCLGFAIDEGENKQKLRQGQVVTDISARDDASASANADAAESAGVSVRHHRVLVCQTDEQFEMARECCLDGELWK